MAIPDMIGITVKDMTASLRFYRLIGLDIPEGVEHEDHVEVITPNGYRIAFDTEEMIKGIVAHWVEPQGQRMALAFKCESPAEVDTLYRKVIDAGYTSSKEPWDAFWGQRYAVVIDPNGLTVDLFAPLP